MFHMQRSLFAAVAVSLLVFILGAADPFDRVELDNPSYGNLAVLEDSGLLDGFDLPQGELSRLELAIMVQRALNTYGARLVDSGETDPATQVALSELVSAFEVELTQLGSAPAIPAATPAVTGGSFELERRIEYLEDKQVSHAGCGSCPPDGPCDKEIEVSLYGDFYIHSLSYNYGLDSTTPVAVYDEDEFSELKVLWGEVGWDVAYDNWSARFSFLWDDQEHAIDMYEAWARYDNPFSDLYGVMGHVLLPFGDNDYYFPTYPAVNDLSFTAAHTIGVGVDNESWGLSAWFFNPDVEHDTDQLMDEIAVVWDITKREATDCWDGWRITAGYMSNLPEHDLRLIGDGPTASEVSAYNLFGRYDWKGNKYHLIADYTTALDEYDVTELDINADGVGDLPSALNLEFVYEPKPDMLWGISYQATDELVDYAESRYSFMYGERLNPMAMLKLEVSHGEYGDFITHGQETDDSFVAEINIAF